VIAKDPTKAKTLYSSIRSKVYCATSGTKISLRSVAKRLKCGVILDWCKLTFESASKRILKFAQYPLWLQTHNTFRLK